MRNGNKRLLYITRVFICYSAITIYASFSFALTNDTKQEDENLEHITVTGEDQISVLRYAMYRAEENFFDAFNNLLTDKDFKITCKIEQKHSFTRLKKRKCKSAFESDITYEVTQAAIRYGGIKNSPLQGEIYVEQKKIRKKQIAEMERLIKESPELQAKLIKLNQAKAKFEHAKQTNEAE